MKKYDVIIIGGGLAGATLGYLLKKQNKKVLILERQKLINKTKLCGGLLTDKSYKLLCEIFGSKEVETLHMMKHNNVIIDNNGIELDIQNLPLYSIKRKDLDDFVINKYISLNGEIIEGKTYQSINLKENNITIDNELYSYDYLVSAEGVFSSIRKTILNKTQNLNFALELEKDKKPIEQVKISFFDKFKGYAWLIPNNKNNVYGIGDVSGNKEIEKNFKYYLNKINIIEEKKKGAFLPDGSDVYLKYKNTFFIGDSAGLIYPITGEGIYLALLSSKTLSENMNKNYLIKMKPTIKNIKTDLFYMNFVYNHKLRNFLFSKYQKNFIITKMINKFVKHIL